MESKRIISLAVLGLLANSCKQRTFNPTGGEVASIAESPQDKVTNALCSYETPYDLRPSFKAAHPEVMSFSDVVRGLPPKKRFALISSLVTNENLRRLLTKNYTVNDTVPDEKVTPFLRDFSHISSNEYALMASAIGYDNRKNTVVESPRMPTMLGNEVDFPAVLTSDVYKTPVAQFEDVKDEAGAPSGFVRGYQVASPLPTYWKGSMAIADILNRLAGAMPVAPDRRDFKVKINNKNVSSVSVFVQELITSGYSISSRIDVRAANFAGLNYKTPDGKILPVAFPAFAWADDLTNLGQTFTPTIKKDGALVELAEAEANAWMKQHPNSNALLLPAIHAEWVVRFAKGDENYEVRWFYGTDGIGFRPSGISLLGSWAGNKTLQNSGYLAEAGFPRMLATAGYFSEYFAKRTLEQKLTHKGYGSVATCADSISFLLSSAESYLARPKFISFIFGEEMLAATRKDLWVGFPRVTSLDYSPLPDDEGSIKKIIDREPAMQDMATPLRNLRQYQNNKGFVAIGVLRTRWGLTSTLLSMPWKALETSPFDAVECSIRKASAGCPEQIVTSKYAELPDRPEFLCGEVINEYNLNAPRPEEPKASGEFICESQAHTVTPFKYSLTKDLKLRVASQKEGKVVAELQAKTKNKAAAVLAGRQVEMMYDARSGTGAGLFIYKLLSDGKFYLKHDGQGDGVPVICK